MAPRAMLMCAVVAMLVICCSAGSSYSSSSSSSSSSSGGGGGIYFGEPGQAQTYSGSFQSGGPGLVVRSGIAESGQSGGSQGVFSSSSSKVDNDGRIHYEVQAGRF